MIENTTIDVCAFGSLNIDFCFTIDELPAIDGSAQIERFEECPGGYAGNFAAAISKLGKMCSVISAVGKDIYGKQLINGLKQKNIDTENVVIVDTFPTGRVFIPINKNGSKITYTLKGANEKYKLSDLNVEKLLDAKIVQVFDPPISVFHQILKIINEEQKVLYAPGSIDAKRGINSLKEIIRHCEILFLNELEINLITGLKEIDTAARSLMDHGCRAVVLTQGARGSLALVRSKAGLKKIYTPPHKVKVVDTTGAGDAFIATFCYAILENKSLEDACLIASIAGALATEKIGA